MLQGTYELALKQPESRSCNAEVSVPALRLNSSEYEPHRRLVYIVTHGMTARVLLRGQLAYMRSRGFDVAVIVGSADGLSDICASEGVKVYHVPIRREIALLHDLLSLIQLVRLLRRLRPEIVNASTPKAGLLGMIAAAICRIPRRIYTLRGLRFETCVGVTRKIMQATEWCAARCAHAVVCVSPSLREVFVDEGLASPGKTVVAGAGSSNGINLGRFDARFLPGDVEQCRNISGICGNSPTIGFVGRLTADKGIVELLKVYRNLRSSISELQLLLVGDFEAGGAVSKNIQSMVSQDQSIFVTGFVSDTTAWYGLLDILVFPSYREGFPNVPLEAAAAGIPVVGFACTGTRDAVCHGRTGTLVPVGDTRALTEAVAMYLNDSGLRSIHGRAGRERVEREFQQVRVWETLHQLYLSENGKPHPDDAVSRDSTEIQNPTLNAAA